MTAFESGYKAALEGKPQDKNPFDPETCPNSAKRWAEGWVRCRKDHTR